MSTWTEPKSTGSEQAVALNMLVKKEFDCGIQ